MSGIGSGVESGHLVMVQSYATLINRKLLIPSSSSPYFAVEKHFFYGVMAAMIQQIAFDEEWYVASHPDVQEAIAAGTVASGWQHYVQHGFYEHRFPYPISVDEAWYLDAYPDVKAALQRQDVASAQGHFEASGFREGRLPFPNFALRAREDFPTPPQTGTE